MGILGCKLFRASSQSLRVTDSSEWIKRKWDPRCSLPKFTVVRLARAHVSVQKLLSGTQSRTEEKLVSSEDRRGKFTLV